MGNSISIQIIRFFRFMRLFQITFFSIIQVKTQYIYALVAWEEDCQNGIPHTEDTQRVLWNCDEDLKIDDALAVGEYAYDAGWINLDKITFDEDKIQEFFGWDKVKTMDAIHKLTQIRVPMIDSNKKNDYFFLHR